MMLTKSQACLELKNQNKVSDEILIQRFLETEDSKYFEQLYAKYARKIISKCIFLLKDPNTAKDASQEIFLKVFLNLSKFKGEAKFSTWVYTVTYNCCIDLLRDSKKYGKIFADEMEKTVDLEEEDPDNELLDIEVSKLRVVLNNIPVEDKAVLMMKYQDSMSVKEISSILDKSESAIKMRLKRAKQKAKKVYEAKFPSISSKAIG